MSATRCTCLRAGLEDRLRLLVSDPNCPAPSHLYDEIEECEE